MPKIIHEHYQHSPEANERFVATSGFEDTPVAYLNHLRADPQVEGLELNGYKYEAVPNGDGKTHYFMSAYFFDPQFRFDLDPRNLNAAPQFYGQVLTAHELAEKGVGHRDTHLGKGGIALPNPPDRGEVNATHLGGGAIPDK